MTNARLNIRMPGSVEFYDGLTDLPATTDALEGTLYIVRYDSEGMESTEMYEFVKRAYRQLDLSTFDESALQEIIEQVETNQTDIETQQLVLSALQDALRQLEKAVADTKDELGVHLTQIISTEEVHGLRFEANKLYIRMDDESVVEFEGGSGADLEEIQQMIKIAMEEHEEKTIFRDRVHGVGIDGGIMEYWDHNKQEWIELYASEFQSYPRVKNLSATSDETGESIEITFDNPVSPTYKKTEVYISDSDITSSDREDLAGVATRIIDDGTTTSYTHPATRNKTYFIMAYAVHDLEGVEHYSSARSASVQALDTKPPEVVTDIEVTTLDSALSITWVNPTDDDLAKVRGVYKSGGAPQSPKDGAVFTDGMETNKTISNLTNGETYHFRFFVYDLTGNVNDDEIMIATGTPSDIPVSATGPGPQELIAGTLEQGYYGTLPASELFTGGDLASLVGISQGTLQHGDTDWLKFAYEGKILFRPMKAIRHSISWNNINATGCAYGAKTVEKDGDEFKVRLMKGALTDPSNDNAPDRGAKGSEWNKLMLPIHEQASDKSWEKPDYVEDDIPDWGIGFTNVDLLTHHSAGAGSRVWCQEKSESLTGRVCRGLVGVSNSTVPGSGSSASEYGWAPILELVQDPAE